jgi:hypothetical protein
MAIAAALVLCFGFLRVRGTGGGELLRLAFDDHLHCAVIHHPSPRVSGEPNELPEPFTELASLVREGMPSEFALILAHQCRDNGRSFFHLTFGDGQRLLSVLITRRKNGESLGNRRRHEARDQFALAAVESGDFFLYSVSDLPPRANSNVLGEISPAVQRFLTQLEG